MHNIAWLKFFLWLKLALAATTHSGEISVAAEGLSASLKGNARFQSFGGKPDAYNNEVNNVGVGGDKSKCPIYCFFQPLASARICRKVNPLCPSATKPATDRGTERTTKASRENPAATLLGT